MEVSLKTFQWETLQNENLLMFRYLANTICLHRPAYHQSLQWSLGEIRKKSLLFTGKFPVKTCGKHCKEFTFEAMIIDDLSTIQVFFQLDYLLDFERKKILKSKAFEHQCLRVWDSCLRNAKLLAWIFLSVNAERHDLINRGTGALKTSNIV